MNCTTILFYLCIACGPPSGAQPSEQQCQAAEAYNANHAGDALLILHNGSPIHEWYHEDWSAERAHPIASGTKSFWGPLAASAVDHGVLTLDERAAETLTEWRDDPRKSHITLRQLLNFTSGLDARVIKNRTEVEQTDVYAAAVQMAAEKDPGTSWSYGPTHHSAFAEVLRRKLAKRGETVRAYLERRILKPLNIQIAAWFEDAAGNPLTSSGVQITAREWAKWGEFIRRGGTTPDGRRLVSETALAECFKGSSAFSMYGLGWWLGTRGADLPDDFKMAAGAGNQQLYVIPSRGLTIVRFGEEGDYSNAEFLDLLLANQPTPAPSP